MLNRIFLIILVLSFLACAGGENFEPRKTLSAGEIIGEGLTPVSQKGKFGFIDTAGQLVIPAQFDEAGYFSEGKAVFGVKKNDTETLYGYIDETGKVIVEPQFRSAEAYSEGYAKVTMPNDFEGKYGYIDDAGKLVIPLQFFSGESFSSGAALVESPVSSNEFVLGYVDKSGNYMIKQTFQNAQNFAENLAAVRINGRWGFINSKGEIVIPPSFKSADSFSEGLAAVCDADEKDSDCCGFIDRDGRFAIAPQFENAKPFREGLAITETGGRYGFINSSGQFVIAPIYPVLDSPFSEGLASVKLASRSFGYIDKTGKVVINPEYSTAGNFTNGLARVEIYEGQRGEMLIYRTAYITHFGKPIWTGDEFERPVGRH